MNKAFKDTENVKEKRKEKFETHNVQSSLDVKKKTQLKKNTTIVFVLLCRVTKSSKEISIYTMDIHGIYRDLYVYHGKTKKYHNSIQNCPFAMIFEPK